jgi:hypothetical protein
VSLFRREHVYASVEFDRVALVRLGADGAARDEAVIALSLDPEQPEEAFRAVGAALAAPAWRGTARSVVLSDRLARYLVMERPEGVRSSAELRLACEARLQASFERAASEWEIAIDARPFARHFFVCALPRRLVDTVRTTFAGEGELVSLRPFIVCELRRLAHRLPAQCWFVAVARDCVTLAGIVENDCRLVRIVAAEQPGVATIQEVLGRESLLTDDIAPDAPTLVAGVLQGDTGTTTMQRADAPSWGTQPSSWTSGYRLALSERWA